MPDCPDVIKGGDSAEGTGAGLDPTKLVPWEGSCRSLGVQLLQQRGWSPPREAEKLGWRSLMAAGWAAYSAKRCMLLISELG